MVFMSIIRKKQVYEGSVNTARLFSPFGQTIGSLPAFSSVSLNIKLNADSVIVGCRKWLENIHITPKLYD